MDAAQWHAKASMGVGHPVVRPSQPAAGRGLGQIATAQGDTVVVIGLTTLRCSKVNFREGGDKESWSRLMATQWLL